MAASLTESARALPGQWEGEVDRQYSMLCRLLQVLARNDDRWGESDQQDAQELLHSLLDYMQTDMADSKPPRLGLRRGSVGLSEFLQVRTAALSLPTQMTE
jgi:hypothetical protein